MEKIISIFANDYLTLQEMAGDRNVSAAEVIHELILLREKGGRAPSPFTQIIIDTFLNYWAAQHGIKYSMTGKDGVAAKQIGNRLAKELESKDPVFVGSVFEKILLSLKGTFYYGKELSAVNGGFNQILVGYKSKNQPDFTGSW